MASDRKRLASTHLPKAPKRIKTIFDDTISIPDDQFEASRSVAGYQKRMHRERRKLAQAKAEKQDTMTATRILEEVMGEAVSGELQNFWKKLVPIHPLGQARQEDIRVRINRKHGFDISMEPEAGRSATLLRDYRDSPAYYGDVEEGLQPQDLGGYDGDIYDYQMEELHKIGDRDIELGRDALLVEEGVEGESQDVADLPWNVGVASSDFGGFNFGLASSLGGTGKALSTPGRISSKYRSRANSVNTFGGGGTPLALAGGRGATKIGEEFGSPFRVDKDKNKDLQESSEIGESELGHTLERDSLNFLHYTKTQASINKKEELLFFDLVPPQKSDRRTAARGFWNLLVLASKGLVSVKQEEEYGKIVVEIV